MRANSPLLFPPALLLGLWGATAWAQTPPAAPEVKQSAPGGEVGAQPEEAAKGLWARANLFGDPGGLRTRAADQGLSFGLTEASEVFGNATGGTRRDVVYEGLTQFSVGLDTEKLFGWAGGTFNVSGYQVHGRGLSQNDLGNNLHTVSSLEAPRGTYLFELWYEQVFADKQLAVRVGQLAADQEFMITTYGALFLNHTFGWPTLPSTDLPSGGPAYPFATPGARLRYKPLENVAVLLGAFNGDPSGSGRGLPQERNPSGTAFSIGQGVFAIGEAQYSINQGDKAEGLPGTYKLGGWYNSLGFPDQLTGLKRRGNWSGYAVMDQMLFRRQDTTDQGVGLFARVMGTPGDRNLVNFYADAGVTYKGILPSRAADTAGVAFAVARIGDAAVRADAAARFGSGGLYPVRRHETVLELTYAVQIAPWWLVQPSAQYAFNLNGGVPNPASPAKRLGDAAVFGVRTNLTF